MWEGEKFVLGTFLWVKAVGTHFISQPRVIVHQQLVTLTLDVITAETQFSVFSCLLRLPDIHRQNLGFFYGCVFA